MIMNASIMKHGRIPLALVLGASLVAVMAVGCNRQPGVRLYDVSGGVTFAGKPVPRGSIVFEPDESRGNAGPASVADVVAGRYRTRPGRGFVGGPARATVYGGDDTLPTETHDTALFAPWATQVDLPRADCTHDFDVPATR